MEAPKNPGSLASFAEKHPEAPMNWVKEEYYAELQQYRHDLAQHFGITVEELHEGSASQV